MMTKTNGGPFWTAKEAAAYFNISKDALYRLCREPGHDRPPFRRISRNILRFPIQEFKDWCHRYDYPKEKP